MKFLRFHALIVVVRATNKKHFFLFVSGTISLVSLGLLVLFILYFFLREATSLAHLKMAYWDTYWAYAEWAIILGTFHPINKYCRSLFYPSKYKKEVYNEDQAYNYNYSYILVCRIVD